MMSSSASAGGGDTMNSSSSSTAAAGGGMMSGGSMLEESCPSEHFLVPLFTTYTSNSTTTSYHTASDTAHTILGIFLLLMVFAWAAYVMDYCRVRRAMRLSGLFQACMGVYLFTWLFLWMRLPSSASELIELWKYSARDMLQLQHLGISLLLFAGGVIDLLQSYDMLTPMSTMRKELESGTATVSTSSTRSSSSTHIQLNHNNASAIWSTAWMMNLIFTGLIFMLHPQHTYAATIKHLLLGTSLIVGATLLKRAKEKAWIAEFDRRVSKRRREGRNGTNNAAPSASTTSSSPINNHVDWSLILAGGWFACAACILLAFREKETEVHIGTTVKCQPAFVVVCMAYVCAGTSILVATWYARQEWKVIRGVPSTSSNPQQRRCHPLLSCLCSCCTSSTRWMAVGNGNGITIDGEEENTEEIELQLDATSPSSAATTTNGTHSQAAPLKQNGTAKDGDNDGDDPLRLDVDDEDELPVTDRTMVHHTSTSNSKKKSPLPISPSAPKSATAAYSSHILPPPTASASPVHVHSLGDLNDYEEDDAAAEEEEYEDVHVDEEELQRERERQRRREEE